RSAWTSLTSDSRTAASSDDLRPALEPLPALPDIVVWPIFTAVRAPGVSPESDPLPALFVGTPGRVTCAAGTAEGTPWVARERSAAERVRRREPQPGQVTIASGVASGPIAVLQRGQFI